MQSFVVDIMWCHDGLMMDEWVLQWLKSLPVHYVLYKVFAIL